MLRFLQIRDYAIVDSLDLEVANGFTCITGETGAGKSILIGALGQLCGDRADTGAIRSGAERSELSAEFSLPGDHPALEWLRAAELEDGESCLLRRVINRNGRSRAWINGTVVTLQQLGELGEMLVEIHGQNEHLRLVRSDEPFRLLDNGGDYDDELAAVRAAFGNWRSVEAERQELLHEKPLDAGDRELLQYQVRELEQEALSADEFSELEAEHRILTQGEELLATLAAAVQTLEGEPGGATRALYRAADRLERHAELDPDIAASVPLLREAVINCDEALSSIQAAQSRIDLSPERLEEVERKLRRQHDLARKHRVEPEELPAVLDGLRSRIERSGSLEQRLNELEEALQRALHAYRRAAQGLHDRRRAQARELSRSVSALMEQLGMPGGEFECGVQLKDDEPPSVRGDDRIELQVSANPGSPLGPLRKVASGGELSRLSLAIRVASRTGSFATQIFDEVDAGIGGETAHAVGALLRGLAAGSQALCVTHLAQVAVFADQQIQVLKTADERETRIATSVLGARDRIDEIARMLGGRLSEQSRAHASELLAMASTQH
jgi:DNA repair protein RecN (Recombination protein N)